MSLLEQVRDYTNLTYHHVCLSPLNPEFLQHRRNMVSVRQTAELVWRGFITFVYLEKEEGSCHGACPEVKGQPEWNTGLGLCAKPHTGSLEKFLNV